MADYTLVEQMLFRGFLTLPAKINGVPVVFKTLNSLESDIVELHTSFDAPSTDQEVGYESAYLIAYSTFLFNRVNILTDRDTYIPKLVDLFLELPMKTIRRIIRYLNSLNRKARQTTEKVQPYSYGPVSQYNWTAYKDMPLNDPRITGISGTESLGVNIQQKLWVFHNTREDIQEDFERQWSLSKFEASVHNPKSVKKIDAKDRDKQKKEQRRKEAMYRNGGANMLEEGPNGEIKVSNETVDELLDQMKRSMEGEKDYHDKIVEQHERKIRSKYEEEKRKREQKKKKSQRKHIDQFKNTDISKDPFIFYDEEEVQQQVAAQKSRKRQMLREGYYQENRAFMERGERLSKWGILEEEVKQQPMPEGKKERSPFEGTIMEDHYKVVEEDISNPDDLDYPDLLDED